MSVPKAVFLDTCVFAGQNYNFSSALFTSFIPVARQSKLKILLPDPTAREVRRQINERSKEALKVLEDARRKAPFLSKWKDFPPKQTVWAEWDVRRVADSEWNDFLSQFEVEKLDYDGVSISKVMSWYDDIRAPFGEGKKRKEFPDAFAIEILSIYAEKHDLCIAVVSEDQDIKKACEHYHSLFYFPSLARLTELLLLGEKGLESQRKALEKSLSLLEVAISSELDGISSYISDDRFQVIGDSYTSAQVTDVRIVGVGFNECTVIFEAEFQSEHELQWEEVFDPIMEDTRVFSDWVTQQNTLSGVAKLITSSKTHEVESISNVRLDLLEIAIHSLPHRW